MSQPIGINSTIDEITLKKRESGEIYVDASEILTIADTANGKTYRITITNGVIQPVEV